VRSWAKRRKRREEKFAQNGFCIFVTPFVISRKCRKGFGLEIKVNIYGATHKFQRA
jgi:hypothetical protein